MLKVLLEKLFSLKNLSTENVCGNIFSSDFKDFSAKNMVELIF